MEGTMKVAVMTGKKKMEWCERDSTARSGRTAD